MPKIVIRCFTQFDVSYSLTQVRSNKKFQINCTELPIARKQKNQKEFNYYFMRFKTTRIYVL